MAGVPIRHIVVSACVGCALVIGTATAFAAPTITNFSFRLGRAAAVATGAPLTATLALYQCTNPFISVSDVRDIAPAKACAVAVAGRGSYRCVDGGYGPAPPFALVRHHYRGWTVSLTPEDAVLFRRGSQSFHTGSQCN